MKLLIFSVGLALIGSNAVNAAAADAAVDRAAALAADGQVAAAIRMLERPSDGRIDPMVLGLLGSLLETDGRDSQALRCYFQILLDPPRDEAAPSFMQLMAHASRAPVVPGFFRPIAALDARLMARGRVLAIGSRMDEGVWQKVVAAIPQAGGAEAWQWRDAIAVNRPVPHAPAGGDTEQWLEFLKRQPTNRVALDLLRESSSREDWQDLRPWVVGHCPKLPPQWEMPLDGRDRPEEYPRWIPINPKRWPELDEAAAGDGMVGLMARLWKADRESNDALGLQIARELHQRYPRREAWAAELALRTHDEAEARILLDEVMKQGEIVFFEALFAIRWFDRSRTPADPAIRAALRRLTRWEILRRPAGSRRWMREAGVLWVGKLATATDPFVPDGGRSQVLKVLKDVQLTLDTMLDGAGSAEIAYQFWLDRDPTMAEDQRMARARRVLLSGAYALDESPWVDWHRFYPLDRPSTSRLPAARALPDLIRMLETRGQDAVFPAPFITALKQADPVTAAWLAKVLQCQSALDLPRVTATDWYRGDPFALDPGGQRALRFGRMWHEFARYQAVLVRAAALPDADQVVD